MRKIAVCTGTRADYGLLRELLRCLAASPDVELQLLVTGMHLSPEFGLTVHEIEQDGFPIADRIEMLLSSDSPAGIAQSIGLGTIGFAASLARLRPDLLVVLGDRFEILAAAAAALPFRIPVAHIHGGEATEGLIDEGIRHAVTKLSHLHFTTTERYRARVIQMGEAPARVFMVGAPGLDAIAATPSMAPGELRRELDLPAERPLGIVTFHPTTLDGDVGEAQTRALMEALTRVDDLFWVITLPNADTHGRIMAEVARRFALERPDRARAFSSLGTRRYVGLLREAAVMVGNSSSGLIEAPSLRLPVVNIGRRQQGRVRGENVIDVPNVHVDAIVPAIRTALSPAFRDQLRTSTNPYGEPGAGARIAAILRTAPLDVTKTFHEVAA